MIIAPLADEIAGARVLDLAAHDGRWTFAFACAGASEVVGIEGRAGLVQSYADFPAVDHKSRSSLRCDDVFDGMEKAIAAGEQYDVIAVLGILYHVMDHMRLFRLIRQLKPKLVIVDSEFAIRNGPVIQLVRERTDKDLNAIAQFPGQERTLIGIPSFPAMEAMADVLGFSCEWIDWTRLPVQRRKPVNDYFRLENKRRATCLLRPV
ncbi:bifunctional 2-polyprenyl-6-hydroxyphenol methylase/3-demethylubiquinol 3-O-methyltransferase UbiG [Thioclava sp. SK-1]|uniref:class I SAM-dependent methyltransferase n=1 Tax=Thioclava sp. SK-1 TaxID=1889770 RepID=UPI00159F3206|nr:DUF1698 domain-containing protein [Thioclava sp. SK-1]